MRKILCSAAITAMAAALPVGLSGAPTLAATTTTWSVSPGGSVSASAGQIELLDRTTNQLFGCESSNVTGSLKSGTGLNGSGIGTISSFSLADGCSASQTGKWRLNLWSYNATKRYVKGTIKKIHFAVSASGCSFVVDGTSDTARNGTVQIGYDNKNHNLSTLNKTGTLHFYDVSGCSPMLNSGDALSLIVGYRLTPSQTITSPWPVPVRVKIGRAHV